MMFFPIKFLHALYTYIWFLEILSSEINYFRKNVGIVLLVYIEKCFKVYLN
jgi:hypothetical protein